MRPPARQHRNDIRRRQRPAILVPAEPDQHPIVAGAAEQVAVEQPGPAAEHRLFRQSGLGLKMLPEQLLKTLVARHARPAPLSPDPSRLTHHIPPFQREKDDAPRAFAYMRS
jgi:hypothetical protein